ncbi:sensor histidine kinase [Adhaeribacter pallidiroseus]|uniref:histidine kinase n=1 Tax=Adhaeribacter pallidiroseus TaxID=2072847 RepID=A0A369QEI5_9BACT|nr:PAS domain-containing sensor histidine kinase [Adhaeribacter pallidiroseus]RDC63124.1 Sensor protein RprX [Adhaeribacter pallidiroseus]
MTSILSLGLRETSLDLLQNGMLALDVVFERITENNFPHSCKTLLHYQALLIGEEVANPIRFAQEAYTHDKYISILLIDDSNTHTKIKQALQYSPFIGPTVQCISNEIGQRMAPIVEDAILRTSQRRSFAKIKRTSFSEQGFAPNILEKVRTDFTTKALEEAPIGVILISDTGTIYSINRYALTLFEQSEKNVLGNAVLALFPEETQGKINSFLLDSYLRESKKVVEVKWSESSQYWELSLTPINMNAASNYKLLLLNNITAPVIAQKRTQAHLEELEELNAHLARVNADLDTFVYTASHDLKSPILNIEGLVTSLEEELGAESTVAMDLAHIKKSIQRFKQTVEDLTAVSRIQKSSEREATLIDMNDLLEEIKQLLEREIIATGANIELNAASGTKFRYPKRDIISIFYNLVSNAIKYHSPFRQPHIQITIRLENGEFHLVVQDNGLGIPVANRERIFQLFKRMHTHVVGSGVGLYIVKKITENNGGQIQVESEEGMGSVFTIRLPEFGTKKIA